MSVAAKDAERERVRLESRGCRHCEGAGMTMVFHPEYAGSTVLYIEDHDRGLIPVAGRVAAHCVCSYGRWMREKTEPEMLPRIPDLQRCIDGESFYVVDDPTEPEELVQLRGGREAVRRLAARLAAGMTTTKGGVR